MAEEKNVQEVEIKSEVKTEAENEKIRKSNFNKIVIIFFLVLFILLFSSVIVMGFINKSLEAELELLRQMTEETEYNINKIEQNVNDTIENAIENIISNETELIENLVESSSKK